MKYEIYIYIALQLKTKAYTQVLKGLYLYSTDKTVSDNFKFILKH